MKTSAPSSTNNSSSDLPLFEHSKNVLRALYPQFNAEQIEMTAEIVSNCTKTIVQNSTSPSDFEARNQAFQRFCQTSLSQTDKAILESTLIDFREKPAGNFPEMDKSMVDSIEKAKKLQQQTCRNCNTPNRLIKTDTGKIQNLLKKCTACKNALYCSRECQRQDWNRHKKVECIFLQKQ